jgi:anaerobic glycerol-3-phosphate dehydrogenase
MLGFQLKKTVMQPACVGLQLGKGDDVGHAMLALRQDNLPKLPPSLKPDGAEVKKPVSSYLQSSLTWKIGGTM